MDLSVAGLPLDADNDVMHPLAAVVVLKGLDEDGNIAYWTYCTSGLTGVEAMGMTTLMLDKLRAGITPSSPPAHE